MHYLIYKTTNLINGKYYIGKHRTKNRDDDYLGSGKLLRAAIKKYGRENFIREIILECSSEEEMNLAEKILVVPDLEVNYNLCPGGQGGWGYLNSNGLNKSDKQKEAARSSISKYHGSDKHRFTSSCIMKKLHKDKRIIIPSWIGKKHLLETKIKIGLNSSIKQKGSRNSQFGTCWMTNGVKNIKIKRDEVDKWIELGYKQGRK